MRLAALGLVLLASACSTTRAVEQKRTLPSPLVAAKLPERPDAVPISPAGDWAVPVADGDTVPEGRSGVLLSPEKAARAARYVVSYNELRGLYEVDLRTWGREREIYEQHLELAQAEMDRLRREAERSWFERHAPQVALVLGVVVGVAATVGIVVAVEGVTVQKAAQ